MTEHLQTPRGRFFTVAASFIVFRVAFVFLYPSFGLPITTLGIIPVLMGAWVYGMWSGVILTLALYLIDALIITFMGWRNFQIAVLPGGLLGLATSIIASLIIGRLGENERKSQEEFRQH